MEATKNEEQITINLSSTQATLFMMALSSGMINLESFQKTFSIVLGDPSGEKNTTGMIQEMSKIGFVVQKELEAFHAKSKSKIDVVSPLTKV